MESLIGNIALDKELQRRAELGRDEAEMHWRPAGAEREGAERGEEANRGTAEQAEDDGKERKRRRTREGERSSGGECSTTPSGHRSEVDCGVRAADVTTTDNTFRRAIGEAIQLLGSMAHDADVAFGQTHGGATRVRDKSNPDRFANVYSAEAKRISLECKKLRRVVRFVHKRQLDKATQLCLALAAGGVELPDVHADESAVVERASAVIKRKRLELQGRSRAQLILNSGGVSGKSQESKQRAATKRDANAVMEGSLRGAVASVTVGAGDGAEDIDSPG